MDYCLWVCSLVLPVVLAVEGRLRCCHLLFSFIFSEVAKYLNLMV
jgi:hypothetical protein